MSVHSELRFGKSSEAAGIGCENCLKDLAALFDDNLNRRAIGEQSGTTKRSKPTVSNRPESRGLHPAGAWSRTCWKQVSRLEEGDKQRNQAMFGTRPESQGLHPAG